MCLQSCETNSLWLDFHLAASVLGMQGPSETWWLYVWTGSQRRWSNGLQWVYGYALYSDYDVQWNAGRDGGELEQLWQPGSLPFKFDAFEILNSIYTVTLFIML